MVRESRPPLFRDRREAGRRLAATVAECVAGEDLLVLALPRGGVPVGFEIAGACGAELDVLVARKIGAPGHSEFALGALAGPGRPEVFLDRDTVARLGVRRDELLPIVRAAALELRRREAVYRKGRPPPRVVGRNVILVDDGLATGATAQAAIRWLRREGTARIELAVPVAAPDSIRALAPRVDALHCLAAPEGFAAVGAHYADFEQVTDLEVLEILARSQGGGRNGSGGAGRR